MPGDIQYALTQQPITHGFAPAPGKVVWVCGTENLGERAGGLRWTLQGVVVVVIMKIGLPGSYIVHPNIYVSLVNICGFYLPGKFFWANGDSFCVFAIIRACKSPGTSPQRQQCLSPRGCRAGSRSRVAGRSHRPRWRARRRAAWAAAFFRPFAPGPSPGLR